MLAGCLFWGVGLQPKTRVMSEVGQGSNKLCCTAFLGGRKPAQLAFVKYLFHTQLSTLQQLTQQAACVEDVVDSSQALECI